MAVPETVRLSEKARQQLLQVRRRTGVHRWNVLCRWAFCLSLAEAAKPQDIDIRLDSNVEMTWRVFTGGGYEKIYLALLRHRCSLDGLPNDEATLLKYFRLHLHRGIGYLSGGKELRRLEDFQKLIGKER